MTVLSVAGAAERALLSCVTRAEAGPAGTRLALIVHLSRLAAPRAHHRRIVRALLEDTAHRLGGAVYALRNRDLVLTAPPAIAIETLSTHLARLLRADVPDARTVLSAWPAGSQAMLDYAHARLQDPAAPDMMEPAHAPGQMQAAADTLAWIGTARLPDLTQRQIVVEAAAGTIRPVWADVAVMPTLLRARLAAVSQMEADPYVLHHVLSQLDSRMTAALIVPPIASVGGAIMADAPRLMAHVHLSIGGVLSPAFAALVEATGFRRGSLGISLPLLDACADPAAFARARARLRDAGAMLVLDGVTCGALAVLNLVGLEPDWVRVDWADALPRGAYTADALARLGAHRIVLAQVSDAAALEWGLSHGIQRFQGRHIDALLAAARLASCPAAGGCVLRQCLERAYATGPAGRAGCRNPALLDAGAPPMAGLP